MYNHIRSILLMGTALVCGHFFTSVAMGQPQDSRWLQPSDGDWGDAANWSTAAFPQNGTPTSTDEYRAIIDAVGSPYQVAIFNTDDDPNQLPFVVYTVSELLLASSDATVRHERGQVNAGQLRLTNGTYLFDGSGSRASLVDTTVHVGPFGSVEFEQATGSPRQPTGAFLRCHIVGNILLDQTGEGVLFEETLSLNGALSLSMPGTLAVFQGSSMLVEGTAIHAVPDSVVAITTQGQGAVTFGPNTTLGGSPNLEGRGGGSHDLRNEGAISIEGFSRIENLRVHNIGTFALADGASVVVREDNVFGGSSFTNEGTVSLGMSAELVFGPRTFTENRGLFEVSPQATVSVREGFDQSSTGTVSFEIDATEGSGVIRASDLDAISTLSGALILTATDTSGFSIGDEFVIMESPNFSGWFNSIASPILDDGLQFWVGRRPAGVTVVVVPTPASIALFSGVALATTSRRARSSRP